MRNNLVLFATGCLVWLMSSCMGDSSSYEYDEVPKNCQISSFTLSHDTISGLSDVKFTIDQLNGRIYNMDSLAYGLKVGKVICKIEYMNSNSVSSLKVIQEAVGDTIDWNASDSLDFSKPVKFIVGAYDGIVTKTYVAHVNVHTLVPDSMTWGMHTNHITGVIMKEQKAIQTTYNGRDCYFLYAQPAGLDLPYRLYYSEVTDMKSWTELSLQGLDPADPVILSQLTEYEGTYYLPSVNGTLYRSYDGLEWAPIVIDIPQVFSILGDVEEGGRQESVLALIIRQGDILQFASMNKDRVLSLGDEVPPEFPLIGFGKENFTSMYHEYLMVVGGKDGNNRLSNSAWGTMDGKSWALLTDEQADYFTPKEGLMVQAYADKILAIGGIDATGRASREIYQTLDKGLTWSLVDSLIVLPETYRARGYASVLVDKDQFISIIGGKTTPNGNELDDIWRGRINRLSYE